MNILIKGGKIVTSCDSFVSDIVIKNEKITEISPDISPDGFDMVYDAFGKYVVPGAIDGHTHLAMPYKDIFTSDDYYTGTRAAACGGTTTVFDFILQQKGEDMGQSVVRQQKSAEGFPAVDYSFHLGISDVSTPNLLNSLEKCPSLGVNSYKVYMVYDFFLNNSDFEKVLKKSRDVGGIVGVHAEDKTLSEHLINQYLSEGKTQPWWHYMSKNEEVAAAANRKAVELALEVGGKFYIAHLSDGDGAQFAKQFVDQNKEIYVESCPQYLVFTNEVYKGKDAELFVCSPPIKGESSRQALLNAVKDGTVSMMATDHCPFFEKDKRATDNGKTGDFTKIPNGCGGIELCYPYMLSLANAGEISFSRTVELCCKNPSKLFGISDRKGDIAVGLDGDIVVYDPKKQVTITNDMLHSMSDHTIYEGQTLKGYPEATFLRGNLVYKNGEFLGKKGMGRYLKQNAPESLYKQI